MTSKDRIDEYYIQIDEILTQLQENADPSLEQLRTMERELSLLRHRAVRQLVAEKLQANESFSIFQALLGVEGGGGIGIGGFLQ